MNRVCMNGRLTRDPELRTTGTGKSVASFSIAVNRRFKREGEPDADFFRVTCWEQAATYLCEYGAKGRLVSVDGRLEQRKFTDKDGNERESIEIVADNVSLLDKPREEGQAPSTPAPATQRGYGAPRPAPDEYDPFADE